MTKENNTDAPFWSDKDYILMNDGFRKRMVLAIMLGQENTPIGVSRKPGTQHPKQISTYQIGGGSPAGLCADIGDKYTIHW